MQSLYAFLNLIFPKYFAVFQAILPCLLLAQNLSSVRLYLQISIRPVILFQATFDSDQFCYKISPTAQFYW